MRSVAVAKGLATASRTKAEAFLARHARLRTAVRWITNPIVIVVALLVAMIAFDVALWLTPLPK